VLDFGIAKLIDVVVEEAVVRGQTITTIGQLIGTPSYMSPEQLQGLREVDARSDVYAMGVILYQMLVGDLPIRGDSIPDIFLKVMTTDPAPVQSLRNDISEELAAVVHRALGREADTRYADGSAMAEALWPFASTWVIGSTPTASDVVVHAVRADGSQPSASSGMSAPVVMETSPKAVADSLSASIRSTPLPRRTTALAAIFGSMIVVGAVAFWHPWSGSSPHAATDAATTVTRTELLSPRDVSALEISPPETTTPDVVPVEHDVQTTPVDAAVDVVRDVYRRVPRDVRPQPSEPLMLQTQ
jgi:serine/threonine protein kinase